MLDFASACWHPVDGCLTQPWKAGLLGNIPNLVHAWSGQGQNLSASRGPDALDHLSKRRLLCEHLRSDFLRLNFCEQVHGTHIEVVKNAYSSEGGGCVGQADGMITAEPNTPLLAFSADCPLLLIYAPDIPAVGLAHSGWRGTLGGMASRMVATMQSTFGARPEAMWAIIGPCAGRCCYEVREDVAEPWQSRFGVDAKTLQAAGDRWMLDLSLANAMQLAESGLCPAQIGLPGICSICDDRFYSYRRMGSATGHSGLMAVLDVG